MTEHQTRSSTDVRNSLELIEVKPGMKFGKQVLTDLLPDVETLLFFGMVFELDHTQVLHLLKMLFNTALVDALTDGDHSTELQGYVLDLAYKAPGVNPGDVSFGAVVPKGEVLPELWKSLEVEVADSIKAVAAKLQSVIGMLPGKKGQMVFQSMMLMNKKRPTIGDYRATIKHPPLKENLIIFDVSGSITAPTVHAVVDDVVALAYEANAHLAIVSNTTTHWDPGAYSSDVVLAASEFGGTHYETLADLLTRDWGTVVTIADYDSSQSAFDYLARNCGGHIDEVLDVSLVTGPTFLAECVGQFADVVRPILIGARDLRRG